MHSFKSKHLLDSIAATTKPPVVEGNENKTAVGTSISRSKADLKTTSSSVTEKANNLVISEKEIQKQESRVKRRLWTCDFLAALTVPLPLSATKTNAKAQPIGAPEVEGPSHQQVTLHCHERTIVHGQLKAVHGKQQQWLLNQLQTPTAVYPSAIIRGTDIRMVEIHFWSWILTI